MDLKIQKRITASLFDVGKKRVWFNPENLTEIKEAITKRDIKNLVKSGAIIIKQEKNISRYRIRKRLLQKKKGRMRGIGSRKGTVNARFSTKKAWMIRIRNQKMFLRDLRDNNKILKKDYRMLYRKAKGGFFRSRRHIELYLEEHKLTKNGN